MMNMEIPLSRYQIISLDHLQGNSFRFQRSFFDPKILKDTFLFSGYISRFNRLKWKSQISQIKCSALEQGLQPKPQPKPMKVDVNIEQIVPLAEPKIRKPSNSVICAQIEKLVLFKSYREALELFEFLEIEGSYDVGSSTYDALINAAIGLRSMRGVKMVVNHMNANGFKPDQYMCNRILLMYIKCGMMNDARKLFDEMPERTLVTWNTIIAGLVESGNFLEAFGLFLLMWDDTSDVGPRIFSTMIRASSCLDHILAGKQIHSCAVKIGLKDDIFVSCSLIDMYSKCGNIDDAHCVFDKMPEKTTVAWNTIIAGYALHGYSEEALSMYYKMKDSGTKMDHFTFSILTRICTRLASLEHAKQAHAGLVRHGFGSDIVANTALVDFYSKWGRIEDAKHVFENMPLKNVISWNAIIGGYGNHGRGTEAVEMFERMLKEGMAPNHVTFLAVLSACSYLGLSNRGWDIFKSMMNGHDVKPRAMHYTCMIELLGREGRLNEALALIKDAPFDPTINMWAALLTACRVHNNFELGKFAAEKLYGMEPEKLSNYIVLLNIYNSSGKLKQAASVIHTLKKRGLKMLPVCTWIEIKKRPHMFLSGDKSHTQSKEIYSKLNEIMMKISENGYVAEKKDLLPDVDETEQRILLYHSEKLAIAFGLINTFESTPLQIMQSHRVCTDCHNVIKLIAMVTKRNIVLRDGSRFHHFKDGVCSCGDYW